MTTLAVLILALAVIVLFSAFLKIHPVPTLLGVGFFYGIATGMPAEMALESLSRGFGASMEKVGFILIAGTVIGVFMEKRGAIHLLADRMIRLTGRKNIPLAMSGIGFITSMAVFADSAFVFLAGLCKKACGKASIPVAVGVGALSASLLASHCMVPPMPAPVTVIGILNANIGLTILFGVTVSFVAAMVSWIFSIWNGRTTITEAEENALIERGMEGKETRTTSEVENSEEADFQGSAFRAVSPILLPLLLILFATLYKNFVPERFQSTYPELTRILLFLGLPVVALIIGAILAIFTLGRVHRKELSVKGELGTAVVQAANILVITSAGGAFGEILRQTTAECGWIENLSGHSFLMILIPFLVSAFLKTTQGSSIVACITAAGMISPLLTNFGLDSEMMRALTVVAIGAGGMVVSHTNDSYFWVVSQFSGFSVRQGLRIVTLGSFVSGMAAALMVTLIAFLIQCFG